MSVTALTGQRKVFVGIDAVEFSRGQIRFDVGLNKRDRTGLWLIEGEIELALVDDLPEAIDPRRNPSRWARGTPVLVQERKSTGVFAVHPYGALVVLNAPTAINLVEPRLVLQVGCALTYRLSQSATSILTLGGLETETTRTQIIQALLDAALIADWVSEISEYPYLGTFSLGSEENPVQTAGAVAFSAGYALWQNNQREIEATPLSVEAKTAPTLVFGVTPNQAGAQTEALLYDANPGEEVVLENFEVTSDKNPEPPVGNYTTTTSVFEEFGSPKAIDSAATGESVLLKRTTITDRQEAFAKHRKDTIEQAEGLILGNKKYTLREAEVKEEDWVYETSTSGKLLSKKLKVTQAYAIALRDFYGGIKPLPAFEDGTYKPDGLSPVIAEETRIDYLYNAVTEVVQEVRTKTNKPQGAIAADEFVEQVQSGTYAIAPGDLVPFSQATTRYKEVRLGEWQKIESTVEVYGDSGQFPPASTVMVGVRIEYKLILGKSTNFSQTSRSGDTQPPASERRPAPETKEDKKPPITKAKLKSATTPQDTKRKEPLEVKFVSDPAQLKPIAETENKLLYGRRLGQRFQVPVIDSLIDNATPNQVWHAIEPDGVRIVYLVDTLTFTHDLESSTVSAEGIWLGTIAPGSETVQLPYQIGRELSTGWKWGTTSRQYPYSLTPELRTVSAGWKWGNRIRPISRSKLTTGWKWGSRISQRKVSSAMGWKWGQNFTLTEAGNPALEGLLSAWTFEGTSGTYLEDKVGTNHLVYQSGAIAQVTGKIGNALELQDTSGTLVQAASTPSLQVGGQSFWFAYWQKTPLGLNGASVGKANPSNPYSEQEWFCYGSSGDGVIYSFSNNGSGVCSIGDFNFSGSNPFDDWFHVACWVDVALSEIGMTIYSLALDQTRTSTGTLPIAISSTSYPLFVAGYSQIDSWDFYKASKPSAAQINAVRESEYPFT